MLHVRRRQFFTNTRLKMKNKTNKDLIGKVPDVVIQNQTKHTGQGFIIETDGVHSQYFHSENYNRAERFKAMLDAEVNWIEQFTKHAPSIGTHYEKILSDLVSEYLPSSVKVGTGFVYDSNCDKVSPQIDLMCYQDLDKSPIYRRDDFVIVQPDVVISVCEVKKSLTCDELKKLVAKTIGCNMGRNPKYPLGIQQMSVFTYQCTSSTKTIVKNLANVIESFLKQFSTKTKSGESVLFSIRHLCLPTIFFLDREEYISVSIKRITTKSTEKENHEICIDILKSGGINGISPFLGSLSVTNKSNHRDHCSSFLNEMLEEVKLKVPVSVMSEMTSLELLNYFQDARSYLQDNKAIGVRFSSFDDPANYNTFESFLKIPTFSWIYR